MHEIKKSFTKAPSSKKSGVRRVKGVSWESEDIYRLLVENANEAIAVISDGAICFANRKFIELSGYSWDELTSRPFIGFIHPDDRDAVVESHEKKLRGELDSDIYPIRVFDKSGNTVWIEVNAVLISWKGKPATLAFANDITERKLVQETLNKSEAMYRLLVENANEAILVVSDGMFRYVNPKTVEITGYSKEELMSTPFIDFVHPADREMITERHARRLRGEIFTSVYTFRAIDKQGNTRWMEISAVLIPWEGKTATLNFVNDVTERKQAADALRKSRADLRELNERLELMIEDERKRIAREIHDGLGQYLTALKMDLSWISRKMTQNERPLLKKVQAMSKLIDTATQMTRRISADLRPAMLDDIGLLAALEWHLGDFQKRTGIIGKFIVHKDDIVVSQDIATALFRIFQEALTNVGRHAGAKKVTVGLKKEDGKLLMSIADDGIGISPEEVTSSSSIGIIGMRERTKMCKGQFRIKGVPGKGTNVKVSIPLKEEDVSAEDTYR